MKNGVRKNWESKVASSLFHPAFCSQKFPGVPRKSVKFPCKDNKASYRPPEWLGLLSKEDSTRGL